MKQFLFTFLIMLAVLSWPVQSLYAQHAHDEAEEHEHSDETGHNDHAEETDDHDDHGHGNHEQEDAHDGHGQGGEEDGHDEHEEGKTEIMPDAAKNAGIDTDTVTAQTIHTVVPLTGRITIDQNTKANVRARFHGIVRDVKVNLGENVEKGQVLAVIESNESLKNYNVIAPINGVVLERNTNLGDVANGAPLFMIADLSNVWAKFHVFPKDADDIKSGQNVRVHTLDESKEGAATIDMLFPTADALSQTSVAIVPLSNEASQWRPGMTVEGDVLIARKEVLLAVKASALQAMEGQKVVFIKEGDNYEKKAVITGISDGEYVEIKSGLETGQEYVSEGSFIIKADLLKSGAEHSH